MIYYSLAEWLEVIYLNLSRFFLLMLFAPSNTIPLTRTVHSLLPPVVDMRVRSWKAIMEHKWAPICAPKIYVQMCYDISTDNFIGAI